jgi:hypothetical protein
MIEEEEKKKRAKMGLGGVPPDDELKKRFRKFDNIRIDKIGENKLKRKEFFSEFTNGNVSEEIQDLFVQADGFSKDQMIDYFVNGLSEEESNIISGLSGEIGNRNAEKYLGSSAFERIKKEPYPNTNSQKKMDVIGQSGVDKNLRYKTVDGNGKIVKNKSDHIEAGKIVGIENKSLGLRSMRNEHSMNRMVGQLQVAKEGNLIDERYVRMTSDFEHLNVEERKEIFDKVDKAGGNIMIAEESSEINKDKAKIILKKVKKEVV